MYFKKMEEKNRIFSIFFTYEKNWNFSGFLCLTSYFSGSNKSTQRLGLGWSDPTQRRHPPNERRHHYPTLRGCVRVRTLPWGSWVGQEGQQTHRAQTQSPVWAHAGHSHLRHQHHIRQRGHSHVQVSNLQETSQDGPDLHCSRLLEDQSEPRSLGVTRCCFALWHQVKGVAYQQTVYQTKLTVSKMTGLNCSRTSLYLLFSLVIVEYFWRILSTNRTIYTLED